MTHDLRELRRRAHPHFTVWDAITVATIALAFVAAWAFAIEARRDVRHPGLPISQAEASR